MAKLLQVTFSLSCKAAYLVGDGAKKLEKRMFELSKAGRLAHQGLLETIKQVQWERQMENTASKWGQNWKYKRMKTVYHVYTRYTILCIVCIYMIHA